MSFSRPHLPRKQWPARWHRPLRTRRQPQKSMSKWRHRTRLQRSLTQDLRRLRSRQHQPVVTRSSLSKHPSLRPQCPIPAQLRLHSQAHRQMAMALLWFRRLTQLQLWPTLVLPHRRSQQRQIPVIPMWSSRLPTPRVLNLTPAR